MIDNEEFFKSVRDPRGYLDEIAGPIDWRRKLREQLFADRGRRSDLTQRPLFVFDLHEGCYSRRWAGKNTALQNVLFSGPNCFLLLPEEHSPAPSPTICYWLAVARYTKTTVDRWINSLPCKVKLERGWAGSYGLEVVARIPDNWKVDRSWPTWFDKIKSRIDMEA